MLRICHVSPHLPPDQAANALLPAQLGEWAHAAGHDVRFLSVEPAQGRVATSALSGRVSRLSLSRSRSRIVRGLRLDTMRRVRTIARALDEIASDADLLHLHSNGLIIEVASAWARRHRVPYVLTLYGTEIWHYRPRRPVDPFARAYHGAREVTFYSERLLTHARTAGLGRPGMSVIYPPVHGAFAPRDQADRERLRRELGISERMLILNVKRLHELAGQRFLIEAFARIARHRTDVRLVICGTGLLRESLERQAELAGIARQVTFTGLVPNEDVARYAAAADVFVLPSLLEALPTVAVEALASGTRVVSADHPGGLELYDLFGDDVLMVPRERSDALATALDAVLAHPQRVRPSTLDIVRTLFGRQAVEAAYVSLYQRLLADSPRSLRQ